MEKDYYQILGIGPEASQSQIRRAYLARIRELQSELLQEMSLLELEEAYRVLGNPPRRQADDVPPHKVPIPSPVTAGSRPAAEPLISREMSEDVIDVSVTRSFRTAHPSFDEIHDRLWRNFREVTPPKSETAQSLTLEIPITPQQALTGGRARVLVPARAECPTCGGRGGMGPFACLHCERRGEIIVEHPVVIAFPSGITEHAVQVPLEQFGIHNFYLTVLFRVTLDVIE